MAGKTIADVTDFGRWSRRRFLTATGAAAALAFAGGLPRSAHGTAATPGSYPFTLGIASGDPLPDSVVIWTRLAPDALDPFGGMEYKPFPVAWQVAEDEGFRRVVRAGSALAQPEYVHSVHVDVRGLRPGREYFYRFKAGSHLSPVGRTKTAPPLGAAVGALAFGVASCQAYFDGYYTAYGHMAQEDLDVVFHLGDYLYEYGVQTNGGRGETLPESFYRTTVTLDDYRGRHALYRSDPDLQAAHAACPWIVTWDDHEVVDNWADENHPSAPPADFLVRRANAFRAYWEHMPLRPPLEPQGPDMPLYRRFTFGSLAEFNVLDTRQYRDDQACNDQLAYDCAERLDPARTLLGAEQEQWLLDGLGSSQATWNVLAQQLMIAQLDFDAGPRQGFGPDLWDGYVPSRERLFTALVEREVSNPIVLSGDIHRSFAADLKPNFDDPASPVIGTEFVGTSISSGGDGADMDDLGRTFLAANPHLRFYNQQRGYVRCDVTPSSWEATYRVVPYVKQRGAPISTRATLTVEAGVPGIAQIDNYPAVGQRFESGETRDALREMSLTEEPKSDA
jgi:alkaline phosphatase D